MTSLLPASTYSGTIEIYRLQYQQQSELRQVSPFVFPRDVLNYVLLIGCLMMTPVPHSALKVLGFLAIVSLSLLSLQSNRTLALAYGILIGISSSWCITVSFNLLFHYKPSQDFKRKIAGRWPVKPGDCTEPSNSDEIQWQGMPTSTYTRLCWIIDLLGSLRVLHWSGGRPKERSLNAIREDGPGSTPTLRQNLGKLLLLYVGVDCLKEVIAIDPYFWGYTDSEPPICIKSTLRYAGFIQPYRMVISFAILYVAIELISTTGVLLFVNILGPSYAGTWGYGWAHRPQLGHLDSVYKKGLQGWWGGWWHQMFRFTLVAPAHALVDTLQIPPKGKIARSLYLVIPFLVSGAIHASGSYTMWGDTKPLNSFLFFALQPAGIATQMAGSWCFNKVGFTAKIHPNLRKATNVAFTVIWFLETFPLLADELARGGLFLSEPSPISLLQVLGIGSVARSHQLWPDYGVHIYRESSWWQVGLAV